MTWTLILWIFAPHEPTTVTQVLGFVDPVQCEIAGAQALVGVKLSAERGGYRRDASFVCVGVGE